ncbi:Glucose dehydrogenase [FAD, quinone] [Orchesella cincta]|uniref:Glucose dehydrogenase [FAD, quinone] n=1 Tax=Orchesella cincta TaxID=48709 RepID=A0A1D2N025_ORCCI|nr:Glucose dehydrogenase [FAD, quinone] [Orchesella cincta]
MLFRPLVGGGSAGSAIAVRLSENPNVRVLLLEAGGDPNPISYVPATASYMFLHPSVDWQYKTASQPNSGYGIIKRVCKNIGHCRNALSFFNAIAGGSSNSNFMIYNRGNPRDFDRWALHTGDARWKYKNVEKYFRKIEDYFGTWDGNGGDIHNGPLRVEAVVYRPGLDDVLKAAQEKGYSIRDQNADQKQGFSPLDLTQKRGVRFSTYRAYIRPNLRRKNLVIYRYTLVTKVDIYKTYLKRVKNTVHLDESKRATGISYLRHGVKGYASASKEIIVSGGTINSPQILMLSGIGPKEHLQQVGVQPLVDLPVGSTLQDHVSTAIGPFIMNKSESLILHRDVDFNALVNYFRNGKGPLTSPQACVAVGLVSTPGHSTDWPNIMYTVASLGMFFGLPYILDTAFSTGKLAESYLGPYVGQDSHVILVTLGLPRSRGFIRLKDNNPLSQPIIDPQYFTDPTDSDIKAMVRGVELIVDLYENTTALQKLNSRLPPTKLPGCENYVLRSPEYYECFIKTVTITNYHPASSLPMGRPYDPHAVVDSQLRVIGVKGLRVCDASVMPYVTNTNTNAPTIMIGEMCADMIKKTWNLL